MNVEGIPRVSPELSTENYNNETGKYNVTSTDIYSRPGNLITPLYRTIFVLLLRAGLLLIQLASIPIKDTTLILLHNVFEFSTASIAYGVIGYIVAYGKDSQQIIGTATWIGAEDADVVNAVTGWAAVVMATGIFTTMVAGRIHLVGLVVVVFIMAAIMDPLMIHWIWTQNGFMHRNELSQLMVSYKDIGGCMVVHIFAGTISLLAIFTLGRRLMRLRDINESSIPPSAPATCFLGYFLLMIGLLDICMPNIIINTQTPYNVSGRILMDNIMAVAGGMLIVIVAQFATDDNINYWTMLRCLQGGIAGLVVVSAGVDGYTPAIAFLLGMAGGVIYYFIAKWLFQTQLEDYCNIIPIHLLCGLIGSLLPPLFGNNKGSAFNKESQVSEIIANLSWQVICDCILLIMFLLIFIVVFLLLKCTGFLRNRNDDVDHRRAQVVQNRSNNVSFMKRLFKPDDPPLLIWPGNESKNIKWYKPKVRESYFNPQLLNGSNASSDYVKMHEQSGLVKRNPTFQAYRVEVVTSRPPLEGYYMNLTSKSAEKSNVEFQMESGSKKDLVDIYNHSGMTDAFNIHTGPFGELDGSTTQVEQYQKQGNGEQHCDEYLNPEFRRQQQTKSKYGINHLCDVDVASRTQNSKANPYRLGDNNYTEYNKRIVKEKTLNAISEGNNYLQMEMGIQPNEKLSEQNIGFSNPKTQSRYKLDKTDKGYTLTFNGNCSIRYEHGSLRTINKPISENNTIQDKHKRKREHNSGIYNKTLDKFKSSRLDLVSANNTQVQPNGCNPNVDIGTRYFTGNLKRGSKSWFNFKKDGKKMKNSTSIKEENQMSDSTKPVRAVQSHNTSVKRESRMKPSRGLRKISLRVESVKRMWRKAHRLNKRRNTKKPEHNRRVGAVRHPGSDLENTADERQLSTCEYGLAEIYSSESENSWVSEPDLSQSNSEQGFANRSMPTISEHSEDHEEKSGESDATYGLNPHDASNATLSSGYRTESASKEILCKTTRSEEPATKSQHQVMHCTVTFPRNYSGVPLYHNMMYKDTRSVRKATSSQDYIIDHNTKISSSNISEDFSKNIIPLYTKSNDDVGVSQVFTIRNYTRASPKVSTSATSEVNIEQRCYEEQENVSTSEACVVDIGFSHEFRSRNSGTLTPNYSSNSPSNDATNKDQPSNKGLAFAQESLKIHHSSQNPSCSSMSPSKDATNKDQPSNKGLAFSQESFKIHLSSQNPSCSSMSPSKNTMHRDQISNETFFQKSMIRHNIALSPRYSSETSSKDSLCNDQSSNNGLVFSQEYMNSYLTASSNDTVNTDQTSNETFSQESIHIHHPTRTPYYSSECTSQELSFKDNRFVEGVGLYREYNFERQDRVVPMLCSEIFSETMISKDSRSDVKATFAQGLHNDKGVSGLTSEQMIYKDKRSDVEETLSQAYIKNRTNVKPRGGKVVTSEKMMYKDTRSD